MKKEKIKEIINKALKLLKKPKVLILLGCVLYLETPFVVLFKEGWFNTNLASLYINPIKIIWKLLHPTILLGVIKFNITLIILGLIASLLLYATGYGDKLIDIDNLKTFFNNISNSSREKNISYSKKSGNHGTAQWLDKGDIKKLNNYIAIDSGEGIIFGYLRGTKNIITLPKKSFNNRNVAVFGASGSMKSRSFVIPNILNLIKSGESMFITDPKGELLRKTSGVLEDNGYIVKALNLNNIPCSDRWAILKEVRDDITAITFAKSIIENTGDGKSDPFWDKGQENLLKALALYVVNEKEEEKQTMSELYSMLTMNDAFNNLKMLFSKLGSEHIASQPWNIFMASAGNEKVSAGMISGLATRLQLFQAEQFKKMTEGNDIDLDLPGKKKCAYFIVIPDSHSAFDFLASLFFSFAFIRLMGLADKKPSGELDIHVNFIMDEFPNIAKIPDFTKKISVIRSRGISVCVIFQNIAQLQQRYPDGQWEEILGNCDNHLFLGANENTTANFISDTLGDATIFEESESKEKYELNPFKGRISGKESKRRLLNPDEVRKMNPFHSVLMLKGQNPIQTEKMDYTKHSKSNEMHDIPIYEMLKEWSEEYHKEWLLKLRENIELNAEMEPEKYEENEKVLMDLNNLLKKYDCTMETKVSVKEPVIEAFDMDDKEETIIGDDNQENLINFEPEKEKLEKEDKFTENFFTEDDIINMDNIESLNNHPVSSSIEPNEILENDCEDNIIDYNGLVNETCVEDTESNTLNNTKSDISIVEFDNIDTKDNIQKTTDDDLEHILKLKNEKENEENKKNTMSNLDGLF
ncbi:VirD4-like conjugal transfer protein, CD1115 family [Clostridium baratii]|uniref:VirD4-like conjugal transfer protein, CD1115 family n=1 Tax=Clostridium baratii TaxID=1561 RepID=UPI0006997241|nr:type IV secretory system conjugative DNA transfer family protein [Clostridium baratii]AQM58624.1 hypothetical protein NPD11_3091 [Clostridium baratii]